MSIARCELRPAAACRPRTRTHARSHARTHGRTARARSAKRRPELCTALGTAGVAVQGADKGVLLVAATDCLTDRRQAVLEEQRAASSVLEAPEGQRAARSALYIPECTADGRYNKLQCYNSTGYCWCVNEDTGKPIPGTSAKDRRPACDTLAPTMKGKLGSLPSGRAGPYS